MKKIAHDDTRVRCLIAEEEKALFTALIAPEQVLRQERHSANQRCDAGFEISFAH